MHKSTLLTVFALLVLARGLSMAGSPLAAEDTVSGPAPVKLNNLLEDMQPVNQITGGPVRLIRIRDRESWLRKRPSVLRRALGMLGNRPEITGPLDVKYGGEHQREGYLEREVSFWSGTGDRINGYLLVPAGAEPSSPAPAVMAMHSTIEPGAKVTVGIEQVRENRYYGMELARRGYVVLAVDVISAGERVYEGCEPFETGPFYERHPCWSGMGKMLSDHMRAVDYLCTLAEVDTSRIGAIGHSLGGHNAFFLQAFDSRVRASVSSCGFVTLGNSGYPFRFARNEWFVHFPDLRDYIRTGIVPCDLHEVLALCAPRPVFNYSARKDHIFPDFWAVDEPLRQVAALYEALGAGDRFVRVFGEGDHDFPPDVRGRAYEWLDRWLKNR